MQKKIEQLFSNLCCSQCKHGFSENSIEIKRLEMGLIVANLTCPNCGKSFGVAFLGLSNVEVKNPDDVPLEVQEGPAPISYDDVIDAHRFFQSLDGNWQNHLPK